MIIKQDNIQAEMKGDKLIITVDVSKKIAENAPKSSSGKNRTLASTRGFLAISNGDTPTYLADLRVGLNVIAK